MLISRFGNLDTNPHGNGVLLHLAKRKHFDVDVQVGGSIGIS